MKKMVVTALLAVSIAVFLFAQTKPATKAGSDPVTASIGRGKLVYAKVCLSCHMADGGGVPRMNPPLIQTSYVLGDKSKLVYIVLKGMTDRVAIEDEYFSNNMAPHTDLNDQQIADVLTYVRNSFGNKASAVTPAEVRETRAGKKK